MKCPFRKSTYVKNTSFWSNYPQEQMIEEDFKDCYKNECALYNKSSGCCGFLKAIAIPIPDTNIQDWRLP